MIKCEEHKECYFTGCVSCQEAMADEIDVLKHKLYFVKNELLDLQDTNLTKWQKLLVDRSIERIIE